MTKAKKITLLSILTGVVVLCVVRWNAWFANPEEPVYEGDTVSYHFYTFGEDYVPGFEWNGSYWQDTVKPDTLQFLLFGDVHNSMDSLQWASIIEHHPDVDFYAQLGDFVEDGNFYYAQHLYHELKGTGFEQLPIVSCPGNHEYRKGIVRRLPAEWTQVFRHPLNGPERFLGTTYYVDFPNLRLVIIDTNGLQRLSDYTIVHTWVTKVLKEAGDRFRVVMMHHPVYSSCVGRQNVFINLSFFNLSSRANLVFSGHDHSYSRRLPFVGTNSATKYYLNKVNPEDTRICSGKQLYQLVTLVADTLTMQTFLTESGDLYDEIRIIRNGSNFETIDLCGNKPEIIELPEKYANRNDAKVRRFLNRRDARLSQDGSQNLR